MNRRLAGFFCLFALSSLFLFFRVGGVVMDENLQQTANTQSRFTLTFGETRGKIYDCRMRTLVGEEVEYVAACLPTPENMAELLSCSAFPADHIEELLESGRPFLTQCSTDQLDIEQVQVFPVEKRNAETQLARHIIGYRNEAGDGITGIEKAYNDFLTAKNAASSISFTVDGLQNPLPGIEPAVSLAPIRTDGVVLTLDSRLQRLVEQAGERYLKKGAIVMMDPSTGKIRACASFPSYTEDTLAEAVQDEENAPMLNRAFSAYNVGSTFKIATAAEALSEGILPETTFFCDGKVNVLDQTFRCHNTLGHGTLDMQHAMMGSCNPYFIQLGLQLNAVRFRGMASDLSFGKATQLANGLFTAKGSLPSERELASPAAVGNLSFGQGSLTATPIQVARMVSAIVNGGRTPEAVLVEGTTQGGNFVEQKAAIPAGIKAMNEETAEQIREFLVASVMEEPNQNAKPRYVTAGGKTATAQTGRFNKTGEELLNGWFAGFFPAENPKYVMVVLAEEAESGNQDASPVFRAVADALYAPLDLSK